MTKINRLGLNDLVVSINYFYQEKRITPNERKALLGGVRRVLNDIELEDDATSIGEKIIYLDSEMKREVK